MTCGRDDERVLPDWWGPPDGWVGGHLHFDLVVARSGAGAILAEDIVVYPTGIGFKLRALLRPEPRIPREPDLDVEAPVPLATGTLGLSIVEGRAPDDFELPETAADRVRFGVEFEDGRRAERGAPVGGPGDFTILAFQEGKPGHPDPATNVVLNSGGGSSSPEFLNERSFIWPLPPGNLRLSGSWVDAEIDGQDVVIDRSVIEEALGRARPGWRD